MSRKEEAKPAVQELDPFELSTAAEPVKQRRIFRAAAAVVSLTLGVVGVAEIQDNSEAQELVTSIDHDALADNKIEYVSLGDSFHAGNGVGGYEGTKGCYQSRLAAPFVLASSIERITNHSYDVVHEHHACSGAITRTSWDPKVTRPEKTITGQTSMAKNIKNAELITLSIGGNNIGFGDTLSCAVLGDSLVGPNTCDGLKPEYLLKKFDYYVNKQNLKKELVETYTVLAGKAPKAKIGIFGYPIVVQKDPGGNCLLDPVEREGAVDLTRWLNAIIRQSISEGNKKIGSERLFYIDLAQAFANRQAQLCNGRESAVNGIRTILMETVHPNAWGHQIMAEEALGFVLKRLGVELRPPRPDTTAPETATTVTEVPTTLPPITVPATTTTQSTTTTTRPTTTITSTSTTVPAPTQPKGSDPGCPPGAPCE